jgi:hypothetical protein
MEVGVKRELKFLTPRGHAAAMPTTIGLRNLDPAALAP